MLCQKNPTQTLSKGTNHSINRLRRSASNRLKVQSPNKGMEIAYVVYFSFMKLCSYLTKNLLTSGMSKLRTLGIIVSVNPKKEKVVI